ncbi:MAG: mRNA 3-end processing factor [Verrucomicrobiaceae bacterium]|nr:mRNA 3-end processing factor [Verrucomicrobiaceae bacterium]
MSDRELIVVNKNGMYCPAGDFYIDPWAPVERAVITHGHSDHSRVGMGEYYATRAGLPILQWRLGEQNFHSYDYGESFTLGSAIISFHPAGHVLGSAQVRIEHDGHVCVVSGDYKRQPDPSCAPFEVIRCDTFITEATFALPIYRWPDTALVARDIVAWVDECKQNGEAAILYCYALGKAQRLLAELARTSADAVYLHGAMLRGVDIYRAAGIDMIETHAVIDEARTGNFAGKLILAPPSAAGSPWLRRFRKAQQGFASGWMSIRGNRRRRNLDRGFVISDHADWPALLRTINETGAKKIIATHGNTDALVRLLNEQGTNASIFQTSNLLQTESGEDD